MNDLVMNFGTQEMKEIRKGDRAIYFFLLVSLCLAAISSLWYLQVSICIALLFLLVLVGVFLQQRTRKKFLRVAMEGGFVDKLIAVRNMYQELQNMDETAQLLRLAVRKCPENYSLPFTQLRSAFRERRIELTNTYIGLRKELAFKAKGFPVWLLPPLRLMSTCYRDFP